MIGSNKSSLLFSIIVNFLAVVSLYTLGSVEGFLKPVAILFGLLIVGSTILAYTSFARSLKNELGRAWMVIWIIVLAIQLFWAFIKAPIDIDGLFYHLPIILEALDKNQWGNWSLKMWHVQNTPKLGEIPNLCMIALGGNHGWRLAQLGHFSTGIIGTLGIYLIAQTMKVKKPSLFALAFWMSPLVLKQMGSNYVDLASWSYWIAAAAFLANLGSHNIILAGMSVFLHAGVKISGPMTAFALLPLLLGNKEKNKISNGFILLTFLIASASLWMIPNLIRFGDPIYPLNLRSMNPASLVPSQLGVGSDFHPPLILASKFISAVLQFFIPEPIAVYDQSGLAWGGLGPFCLVLVFWWLVKFRSLLVARPYSKAFLLSLVIYFLLMPGREVPRHGFALGLAIIVLGLLIFDAFLMENRKAKIAARMIVFRKGRAIKIAKPAVPSRRTRKNSGSIYRLSIISLYHVLRTLVPSS